MNATELREFLSEKDERQDLFESYIQSETTRDTEIDGVIFKFVDSTEITRDGGYSYVFSVNGNLFLVNHYYDSWNGTDHNYDFEQVKPVEKIYTDYECI